jgi:hypothetical protein
MSRASCRRAKGTDIDPPDFCRRTDCRIPVFPVEQHRGSLPSKVHHALILKYFTLHLIESACCWRQLVDHIGSLFRKPDRIDNLAHRVKLQVGISLQQGINRFL